MKYKNFIQHLLYILLFLQSSFYVFFSQENSKDSLNYITYYQYRNEAMFYFYEQDFKEAKKYYENLLQMNLKVFENDLYFYARTLSELDDTLRAIKILYALYFSKNLAKDTFYFKNISLSTKNNIINEARKKEASKIDNSTQVYLLNKWKYFDSIDQKLRLFLKDSLVKLNLNQNEINALKDSIWKLDRKNLAYMDSLIKIHGFTIEHFPASQRNPMISHFILHSSPEWFSYNRDFLFTQVKLGKLSPKTFAAGIDRLLYTFNGLYEYYGQHVGNMDENIDCNTYFLRCNELGISPYFEKENLYKPKGTLPKTSKFYETYKKYKAMYNCVTID
ncbi:MAG: tetratricopeptide repeat protein [Flavobacteriia bacterium]|nr:tetratricopeptide repeat protein [Flavobacteriia bacterium]